MRTSWLALGITLLLIPHRAGADTPPAQTLEQAPVPKTEGETLIPLPKLVGRSLGLVKQPAVFSWRDSAWMLGVHAGQPVEYNNFDASSSGLHLRIPSDSWLYRMSLDRILVRDTASSRSLIDSPYFQAGKPSRLEWRHGVEWPLHEGVGLAPSSFIPPTQFLLLGVLELGFCYYPGGPLKDVLGLYRTRLTPEEQSRIEAGAPIGMRVSLARHDVSVGFQWDNYFKEGVYWSFRALYSYAPAADTDDLKAWLHFSIGVGYAP